MSWTVWSAAVAAGILVSLLGATAQSDPVSESELLPFPAAPRNCRTKSDCESWQMCRFHPQGRCCWPAGCPGGCGGGQVCVRREQPCRASVVTRCACPPRFVCEDAPPTAAPAPEPTPAAISTCSPPCEAGFSCQPAGKFSPLLGTVKYECVKPPRHDCRPGWRYSHKRGCCWPYTCDPPCGPHESCQELPTACAYPGPHPHRCSCRPVYTCRPHHHCKGPHCCKEKPCIVPYHDHTH